MTPPGYDLTGKVAIVTGGSEGIGAATARLLASCGASVVIAGRTDAKLAHASKAIEAAGGGRCLGIQTDIRDEAQVKRMVSGAIDAFGRVDVLINNAAGSVPGRLSDINAAAWHADFAYNVDGAFYCTQAAGRHFTEQGSGAIVNVSSLAGDSGTRGFAAYSAAKAALQMFTRVAAAEWGPLGVRVNAVAPGLIATENAVRECGAMGLDMTAACSNRPLRRPGTPEEVASAIVFLASDAASYVTGVTLQLSGGPDI